MITDADLLLFIATMLLAGVVVRYGRLLLAKVICWLYRRNWERLRRWEV